MRIIAGTARSRRLTAPAGRTTRPITDRAKEGIFNMVSSLGGVEDARVLDLYAGAGSFGLECLSRGAAHVTFVESDRAALSALRTNIENLGFADRSTVVAGPVERVLGDRVGEPVDLAFCDPPYGDDPWEQLFDLIRAELVVAHSDAPIELPDGWVEVRRRQYGRPHIVIARPQVGFSGFDEVPQ